MNIQKLENKEQSLSAEILPDHAGSINNISITKDSETISLIDGYKSDAELKDNVGSKSSLLAPFPNRIEDGKFTFKNVEYQFPINMPNENNAIHGFIENKSFVIVDSSEANLVLRYEYDGSADYFPFPFSIDIEYELKKNELSCKTIATNTGDREMPFGFGWHPYFKIGDSVNNLKLKIPEVEEIQVNERLIPTGDSNGFSKFKELQSIDTTEFDTGFILFGGSNQVELLNKEMGVGINVILKEGYDYLQIYTPPNRKTIAIEPMTCEANALNSHKGLKILRPKESFLAIYTIGVV